MRVESDNPCYLIIQKILKDEHHQMLCIALQPHQNCQKHDFLKSRIAEDDPSNLHDFIAPLDHVERSVLHL